MVSYLVALDLTLSSPLLFELFSVCQLFIESPCLAVIGHCWQDTLVKYLFLSDMGSCLSWSILFFFSKTAPCCSDPGTDFFFCSVFEMCGLPEVLEFFFFTVCTVCRVFYFSLEYFPGQISDLLSSDCSSVFPFVLFFSLKRATLSANLKFARFSPSTLIASEMSAI